MPTNDDELHQTVKDIVGIDIPRRACCEGHVSPFFAFAEAFFARSPVTVWHGSRGLSGKSLTLATLGYLEAVLLGASVSVAGGSGEQAERVHTYMLGDSRSNIPGTFWAHPNAPKHLLVSDPTKRYTTLSNGGYIQVILASQKSARGAHPSRLRVDECDELELSLLDALFGQPMVSRNIATQIVMSSTWHHSDGTFSEVLRRADENGWPVRRWCFEETSLPHGWLSRAEIEAKRKLITAAMWQSEFELAEPNPGERAFDPAKVDAMFRKELGEYSGDEPWLVFEEPDPAGYYVTGADWARKVDATCITSWRTDVYPMRLVAYSRMGRQPWPDMVSMFDQHVLTYPGYAGHDATGLGDVVAGFLSVPAYGFILQGKMRYNVLNGYIGAVERGQYAAPMIRRMYNEHKRASRGDLFGTGEHLPDTVCASAIASAISSSSGWVMGMAG